MEYANLRGEGSNPVPLPPPACLRERILWVNLRAIQPSNSSDFSFGLRLPIGRGGLFFSEKPVFLRSSGLYPFGKDFEIRTFGVAYGLQRKEFCRVISDWRERLFLTPYRGSNPPASVSHSAFKSISFIG